MKELKNLIRLALILAAVVLLALLFAGCAETEDSVSIEERINQFVHDLNTDAERDDIWENLHPDICDPYKHSGLWDGEFAYVNRPFTISVSVNEPIAEGIMINGITNYSIKMYFKQDGNDWYIIQIDLDGVQEIPVS